MERPIDACVVLMGCTAPGRLESLDNVVDSIESHGIPFKQKIITIDLFEDAPLPDDFAPKYNARGWTVTVSPERGMVANLNNALRLVNEDWVFYTEDDVIIHQLPTKEQFGRMVKVRDKNRPPGIISYTYGGYDFKHMSQEELRVSAANPAQFKRFEEFLYWVRDESLVRGYHVEFPVTFFRTDLLRQCLERAKIECKGRFIESALTLGWFSLGLESQYHKATLLKYDEYVIEDIQMTDPKQYESEVILTRGRNLWATQGLATTTGTKTF